MVYIFANPNDTRFIDYITDSFKGTDVIEEPALRDDHRSYK